MFGNPDEFAIELGFTKTRNKYKLRFWIGGAKIGTFTKSGELTYSVKAYHRFTNNKEFYYLPIFDNLTPTRIFFYFTDYTLLLSEKDEDLEEAERRSEFFLFFGKQFTNDGSDLILLYKDLKVFFMYTKAKPNDERAYSSEVSYSTFCHLFDEYISYCE